MKRLMPSGLITYLQGSPNNLIADLFTISLPNGQSINATSGQFTITVPSGTAGWVDGSGNNLSTTTFDATKFGVWTRGAITLEGGFELNSNSMDLTLVPGTTTLYPGLQLPILNAALNGLFDGATVQVWTAYMPLGSYGDVSNGIETKFYGNIDEITNIDSTCVTFAVKDPFNLLGGSAGKVPRRLFKPDCPWQFGDGNCAISTSGTDSNGFHITQAFTAASGSTAWSLTPTTAFTQPSGYFTQGIVTCTAGANNGLSQTVKLHSGNTLQMMNPWILTPQVGDTFSVVAGCDKTATTCQAKFNNLPNFGGTPFVPPASNAV